MASSNGDAKRPKQQEVEEGHLPVSEFLFDRAGAGSPYGEEVEFPMPAEGLSYEHPAPQPPRER